MDALGALILGEKPKAQGGPTDTNVGNLRQPGKQEFQQFATREEGLKALDNQLKIYGEKHKVDTLRSLVTRYAPPSENDTEGYIKFLSDRTGIKPDQKIDLTDPVQRHIISGPMVVMEKGTKNVFKAPQQTNVQPSQQTAPQAQESGDPLANLILGEKSAQTAPKAEAKPKPAVSDVPLPVSVGGQIQNVETQAQPVAQKQQPAKMTPTDVLARLATRNIVPEPVTGAAETAATFLTGALAPWTGAAYGAYKNITEGKNERIDQPKFGEAVTYTPKTESGKKMVSAIGEAIPEEFEKVPLYVPGAGGVAALAKGAKAQAIAKGAKAIEPVTQKVTTALSEIKAGVPKVAEKPATQVTAMPNVTKPTVDKPFVEYNYAPKGSVTPDEQTARQDVLRRIGLNEARQSSVFGDGKMAANEYTTSNLLTPEGDFYKQQFANERSALENQAQRIIQKTGGSVGMDNEVLYSRGQSIAQPFDDFKKLLKTEMDNAYKMAEQKAAGQNAVNLAELKAVLDQKSNFTVNDSFRSLRRGLNDYLRETGIMDKEGKLRNVTVAEAENIRKYMNSNWDRDRSRLIGKINSAIDNDVTKIAGEDIYKKARDVRTKIGRVLDDPKGVAKIMDYDPQNPMNRATAFEKIPETVERMSFDQYDHLVKTLKSMPKELRGPADKALAEIRGHMANRLYQEGSKNQGQWNAKNVTNYLNKNSKKMRLLTQDKELAQMINDLNAAGHILKHDQSYKGAAVQSHNLIKMGAVPTLTALGGAVGTAVGGAFGAPGLGATVGAGVGAAKGVKIAEKSALKSAQKRVIKLEEKQKGKNKVSDFSLKD